MTYGHITLSPAIKNPALISEKRELYNKQLRGEIERPIAPPSPTAFDPPQPTESTSTSSPNGERHLSTPATTGVVPGSLGTLEIAIRNGSAARTLEVQRGATVVLELI